MKCCKNGIAHSLGVRKNFIVPETQYGEALIPEPLVAPLVSRTIYMLGAIGLNYELPGKADKIYDKISDLLLAPEFGIGHSSGSQH